jgi:hypothetical protein
MRGIAGAVDWGLASLGFQMVGSVLLALDVFAVPVRETIHELTRKGYYTWLWIVLLLLFVLSMLVPIERSPIWILLWPVQWIPSLVGPSVPALSEALPAQHANTFQSLTIAISETVLKTLESVPLLDWWVSVGAARQPVFDFAAIRRIATSPVTVVGLPSMTLYLLALYWWNRKGGRPPYYTPLSESLLRSDEPATPKLNPMVREALLAISIPLYLAGTLYALAVLPQLAAKFFAYAAVMILVAVPLFVPVVPLSVGYYLEDADYVTSGPRFAGFLLLAVGFGLEFAKTVTAG